MLAREPRPLDEALSLLVCLVIAQVLVGAPARAQDAEPLRGWDDTAAVDATLSDLSPRPLAAPWFENWDFWLWMDDGSFALVQFMTSSFGFGIELQGSARMIYIEPDAINVGADGTDGIFRADRGFQGRDGDWGWDEEDPVDIFWHDCHVIGGEDSIEVHIDGRRHRSYLEITLTPEVGLTQPGDGRIEYGWDRHNRYTMQAIPRFSFEGRVNFKDERDDPDDWRAIAGVGSFSHSRSNAFPYQIAERWLRFRALRPDGLTIYVDEVRAPDQYTPSSVSWVLVALDGEVLFESFAATVSVTGTSPESEESGVYAVPTSYVIRAAEGGDEVVLEVGGSRFVSSENPLRQLSPLLRRVLARLMSPMEYELTNTYGAYLRIDGVEASVTGTGWTSTSFPMATAP